jgi:hypothetical protein
MTGTPDPNPGDEVAGGGSEHTFPSTTWAWKQVRIARPPEATRTAAARGHRWRKLPRRNARDPLAITVKLRGGPEGWVEVHARGDFSRYPGYTSILDVVLDVNSHWR